MFEDCNDWALELYPKKDKEVTENAGEGTAINKKIDTLLEQMVVPKLAHIEAYKYYDEDNEIEPTEGDTKTEIMITYPILYKDRHGNYGSTGTFWVSNKDEAIKYCEYQNYTFVRLVTEVTELIKIKTKTYQLQWVKINE